MPWQLLIALVFGAALGSFVNVVSLRFKEGKAALTGRSYCPHCRRSLQWWELVPLLSFFLLRGRCSTCQARIAWQYPFIEALTAFAWTVIFAVAPLSFAGYTAAAVTATIATVLLLLWLIDLKYFLLPDRYVVLLSFLVVIHVWLKGAPALTSALAGLFLGAGFLFLIWAATRGQGLGFGDVKLMLPLGLLFGASGTLALLLLAFMAGGVSAAYLLLRRRAGLKTAVPFGPFLIAAAFVLLVDPDVPQRIFASLAWVA